MDVSDRCRRFVHPVGQNVLPNDGIEKRGFSATEFAYNCDPEFVVFQLEFGVR